MSDQDKFEQAVLDHQASVNERGFGAPMSEADVAKHFGEAAPEPKVSKPLPTTEEEVKKYEQELHWSNDIYRIAARVKNNARTSGPLTPAAEMLCNSFVHVLKALYDFSETVEDAKTKEALIQVIRKQEHMPADVVAAASAGLKRKNDSRS